MFELYNTSAFKCSKVITNLYSTSFSLGIKTLDKRLHAPIYAIYGFVRYADEIVDTFPGDDVESLLEEFRQDTFKAIAQKISLNPVLQAFQLVVNQYQIDHDLIEAFLESMAMDLNQKVHNQESLDKYIYGSAEVVGLMCLKVFCNGDQKAYDALKAPARSLGAAFQKVNFLRDLKSDFDDRGRTYFPNIDFGHFSEADKKSIEADIEKDFQDAYIGIKKLPAKARFGVYSAYVYYLRLFKKIRSLPANTIKEQRIRIPNPVKIYLLIRSYIRIRLNTL